VNRTSLSWHAFSLTAVYQTYNGAKILNPLRRRKKMRKAVITLTVVAVFALFFAPGPHAKAQMMGPGMMGPGMMGPGGYGMMGPGAAGQGGYGQQWNYCPYCGRPLPKGGYGYGYGMMGPGMMGGGMMGMMGRGMMGPGMMGQGAYGMMGRGGMGPGMMAPGQGMGPQYGAGQQKPLTEKDVRGILQNYLKSTRNPNLKLGKITDKGNGFEAEIVTKKEGALVDKIFVDKATGWMRSVY